MRTAAACRSSMASSPARISASPCPSAHSAIDRPAIDRRISRRRNRRMPRKPATRSARIAKLVAVVALELIAVTLLAALVGCTDLLTRADPRAAAPARVIDRQAMSATLITGYLENLQRLVQSAPAEQAEIATAAQREYDT